jgi:dihydrofolate synthase/folylpolyglutamate synthase
VAVGVRWGLERTFDALADLGDPHLRYASVHVGGTNGKGSVASTVDTVLREHGLRSVLYTSPHLCSFRERFLLDGLPVDEALLLDAADGVRDVVERHGLTFFEAATVLGFHLFAEVGAEVAVVEVGLGGRLDATNVLTPACSAITNVAMDHADFLGDTLPQIALEKAGIIKAGIPALTAERDPDLLEIFRRVARERGADLTVLDLDRDLHDLELDRTHTGFVLETRSWGALRLRTPLVGRHQACNAALAVEALEHLPERLRPTAEAVVRGVGRVRWPGRDQIETLDGGTWIFDVAHNVAGTESLVDTLDRLDLPRPLVAVVGVLGDKEWGVMLPPLFERVERAFLTLSPSAPLERRWNPREAMAVVEGLPGGTPCPLAVEEDFPEALRRARRAAGEGTVVVTGSVYTVGSALRTLGLEPFPARP